MAVLSIDLAHRSYSDVGVCSLRSRHDHVVASPISLADRGLSGRPTVGELAREIAAVADKVGAGLLFVDGPQGWKSPHNQLAHSRVCERELATQGKTGLPGTTKPSNYLPFITFSVEFFDELSNLGWPRLSDPESLGSSGRFALESFPTSAWRSLGLRPLPGKRKTTPESFETAQGSLTGLIPIEITESLNHDQLQALVAGLAGIAIERGQRAGYVVRGAPPFILDGTWREGYIVNPTPRAAV